MAHLTCTGGVFGGGERAAQSIMEYHVPGGDLPGRPHYVALGHLHRRQRIPAPAPVHYSGAPLADRLRRAGQHQRRLPGRGRPRTRRPRSPTCRSPSGRRLRTVTGTVEEILADPDDLRRGLSAGLGPAADVRRDARGAARRAAQRAGDPDRPAVHAWLRTRTWFASAMPPRRRRSCSPSTARTPGSTTLGSRSCSTSCTTS